MKYRSFFLLIGVAIALSQFSVSGATPADAEWRKVESAMKSVRDVNERSRSFDERVKRLKSELVAFDAALQKFLAIASNDPRRWEAKLFDASVQTERTLAGLPLTVDPPMAHDEIVNAPDADAAIKERASGAKVTALWWKIDKGETTPGEWIKAADAHLQAFPNDKSNGWIKQRRASMQAAVDAMSKPIDLKFIAVDGSEVDLNKMRGKVVLIHFWSPGNASVVADLSKITGAYLRQNPKGFEVIGIALDKDKPKVRKFVKDRDIPWAQHCDGKTWENEFAARFGIRATPAMWLVDKKGMVVSISVRENLEAEVEKRLAE
jgi:hypothetical protein